MLVIHKVHLVIILAKVVKLKKQKKLDIYDVGDVILNMNGINPGTRFAGTWELTSKGRAIIGVDPNDNNYNQAGLTMGEKEHTLTQSEGPAETVYADGVNGQAWSPGVWQNYNGYTLKKDGGLPHNNIPPSMTLYVWLRTA